MFNLFHFKFNSCKDESHWDSPLSCVIWQHIDGYFLALPSGEGLHRHQAGRRDREAVVPQVYGLHDEEGRKLCHSQAEENRGGVPSSLLLFCFPTLFSQTSLTIVFLLTLQGYDISFLITNFHTEEMLRHKLVDFVIHFMEVRKYLH